MLDYSASPAIDILSMSYLKYRDFSARVIDEINDSVVALTNPESVVVDRSRVAANEAHRLACAGGIL